ncbi:ADP-ribosyltransferase [Escherichia coli]|uniref:ADP-ribosyltransferase n=1 Tax=Escherichia coli TaxID=562 RepID=UPI0020255B5C|nr:ADP-ribosyltransferase [Escherichia coli]
MPIINSVHIRRMLGLHVSGNEMKEISRKYQSGNISYIDKYLKRDIKRISKTINNTNKPKCHEMAKFLLILKDTCYYTSFSKKSLDEYVIKYGHGFVGNTCNENIPSPPAATNTPTNNSSEHVNVYSKKTMNNFQKNTGGRYKNLNEHANLYSEKTIDALKRYTGSEYKELNDALRRGLPLDKKMWEIKKGLDEIFSKNPNDGFLLKTFRGVPRKTNLSDLKEGEIGIVKGYLSTSRNVNNARGFQGGGWRGV